MQAVPDLGVLDFAEVAVDFQHKLAEIVGLFVHPQIPVQFRLLHHFPDLGFQGGQLGRVQRLALVVFVHQLFQAGDVAIGVGGGHRRDEVVDDGGVGAAFGLGAFAGVVDDEGVEQGQVAQGHLRVAGAGEAHALAGQPLQGAVLAKVDHRVGAEHLAQPAVVADVVVGGRQVGVVIDGDGVGAEAARGLQAHEHIAHRQAGDGQAVAGAIDLARRVAPGVLQFGLHRRGKSGVPGGVVAPFNMAGGQAQLFLAEGVGVVAATGDDALHQFVAVGGDVLNPVAGIPQGVQDVDGGGRGVQAHGVADAGVFGGVVA